MKINKVFKNIFFSFIQQLSRIIFNFILPPMIITKYGSAVNGLIALIKQIMGYAQLTGAGIGASSTFEMYQPLYNGDNKKLSGIYAETNKLFLRAGNAFTIIVLIVSLIYPFFVGSELNYLSVGLLIVIIGITGASEFYIYGKYQSIINANQDNYIISIAQFIGDLLNVVVTVLLIMMNMDILIVQLGASIIYLFRIFILKFYVSKNYTFLDYSVPPLKGSIRQRGDAIVHQVGVLVVFGSSTFILGMVKGLEEASIYSIYALIFSGISTFCGMVSTAIYSSFGELIAKNKTEQLCKAFNIYEFFYYMIMFIVYTVSYIMIMPFISIYTANLKDINYYLPVLGILFVFVGIATNLRVPANTMVQAAGHFKKTKNRAIIEIVLNITCQLFFCYLYGIYGILIGCLVSFSYRTIDFILYTNKYIVVRSNTISLLRVIRNVIIAIINICFVNAIYNINCTSYMGWAIYAIIIIVQCTLTFLICNFCFESQMFQECKSLVKKVVRRG